MVRKRNSRRVRHTLLLPGPVGLHQVLKKLPGEGGGTVEQWRIEGNSPNMLTRVGWKREMIKPGDQVTVIGFPAKNGKKVMRMDSIVLTNGQKFDGQGLKY